MDDLPRDNNLKDHALFDERHFGATSPSVLYEKKAIKGADGKEFEGLYSAWVSINNPENKSPRAILLMPLNKKTTIAITLKRLASVIRFTKISSYSG